MNPRHMKTRKGTLDMSRPVPHVHTRPTHTSERQTWMTPRWILDLVEQLGPIALDPCAATEPEYNFAEVNFPAAVNGLVQHWQRGGLAFVNHEYGRAIPEWVAKCALEAEAGVEIVQLCPARPGAIWYRDCKSNANAMCELDGRVLFDEHWCKNPAPFPSALFYYGPRPYLFMHVFDLQGEVRRLL